MPGKGESSRSTVDRSASGLNDGDGEPHRPGEPIWITLAVLAVAVLLLFLVRGILTPFIVAAVLAYLADPAVHWIEKRTRLPRLTIVSLFFLIVLVPIGVLLWLVWPALESETKELATNAPAILNNLLSQLFGGGSVAVLGETFDAEIVSRYLLSSLSGVLGTPSEAIHLASTVFGVLLDAFLSVVLLFYFLLEPTAIGSVVIRLVPREHRAHWKMVAREIHGVMGRYVRGLAFLVCLMSVATWVGLAFIFRLPFAIPIALATGFLEIIPFLGPLMAGTLAAVVGLAYGGVGYAASIAIFYLILRELEDQLVMPVVIGRAVEIPPPLAIFAVLAGGSIGGVLGALLGIPVTAAAKIAFDRWRPDQ